jgi:asparagine synthase (glutamine-hydrolysing)
MCGFCGILQLASAPPHPGGELLDRMTDSMVHRGPDDRGTWQSDHIALGHRRLAVIDLSRAGRQPMTNEDGSLVLVHNGEVYNFRELKERHHLARRGHVFRSRTDSEVLLHLFEELGLRMLHELNGMFALALWDARAQALYLARDRFGIKPLFYQSDGLHFRFASEIKAILADARVPRRVSLQAMHDFLSFDYVPGPQTAFEGIHELPPGHWMRVGRDGDLRMERYWDLPMETDESLGEAAAVRRARELVETAVRSQLVADVPLGVLLSGGLDSSTLVGVMSRQASARIRTYSVGFEDPSFDERPAARRVAEQFGTLHREVVVTSQAVRELLPGYLRFIDEPYADGSAIPTYLISGLAREEVVVVLSGEGGDEAFAGYETYAAFKAARLFRRVPGWLRRSVLLPMASRLPVSHDKLSLEFRVKRFLGGIDLDPLEAHVWWRLVLTESQKLALYSPPVREALAPLDPARHLREAFGRRPTHDVLDRLLHADAAVFLPDDLMIKNDRMTMAHSLEARVPFTDLALTEFMARVPARLKLPGLRKKHILRAATADLLPSAIRRRRKVGLELPYSRWLTGDLADLLRAYCGRDRLQAAGLFRPEAVGRLVEEHLGRRQDHGRALWGLLNFMMWHELYLGG